MIPAESRALMQRELDEQPDILGRAAAVLSDTAAAIRPRKDRPLRVGGCGDSLFAAQAMARHFRVNGFDMRPVSAAEMLWDSDIRAGDTVVGLSVSGTTRRTVEAITAAKSVGAHTVALTLRADSALAQAADSVLVLPYTPISRAIPHGLDYHVTLVALAALAGPVDPPTVAGLFGHQTPRLLREARNIARGLSREARFFFLGGGAALGSAGYGAAKLHEAGGIPAWSFEAENFCHGPQFMLRRGDHAVLCGSGGPADARTAALRAGLERLGVSVSEAGLDGGRDAPLLTALHAALSTQALCLAVADARDLDVTDPACGTAAADVQRDWFGWPAG